MKYLLFTCLFALAIICRANTVGNDTIPYWTITYGKTVIITGNVTEQQSKRYELTVWPDAVKDLVISFVYDAVQPEIGSLVVKEKNEVLRTLELDPVMGAYFRVPVRELIGTHQPNVRYELDFYYTDDRGQKNRKLGTIIFSFK